MKKLRFQIMIVKLRRLSKHTSILNLRMRRIKWRRQRLNMLRPVRRAKARRNKPTLLSRRPTRPPRLQIIY